VQVGKEFTGGRGVDAILDMVGGNYCKNRSKPAPDFGRKRQVISAESGR
jgi:NADPH:quinone reductase-like Zn-dependent oxidoreductase